MTSRKRRLQHSSLGIGALGIRAMHLTPLHTICSIPRREREFPTDTQGIRAPVRHRRGLPSLPLHVALAARLGLSAMRNSSWLVGQAGPVPVPQVPLRSLRYSWHNLPGHSSSSDDVVPRHVACYEPEDRGQRLGTSEGSGLGQLQERLVHAPQAPTRHGEAGERSSSWCCRG